MNRKTIRLTESDLHNIVQESVMNVLMENEMEEGKVNQLKSGFSTFFNGSGGLMDRLKRSKKNYQAQGELDDLNELRQKLEQYIDAGMIDPQITVARLIGGKYNGNRFGKLTGQIGNRKGYISKLGGSSY